MDVTKRSKWQYSSIYIYISIIVLVVFESVHCSKSPAALPSPPPVGDSIVPAVDPPLATTIVFFTDYCETLALTLPVVMDTTIFVVGVFVVTIDHSSVICIIQRSLFCNNANIWMS